jgi:hypothetical protein
MPSTGPTSPKALAIIAVLCTLLLVAFFAVPTLMGVANTAAGDPQTANQATQARNVAKAQNPR